MLLTKVKTNHYKREAYKEINRSIRIVEQLMRDKVDLLKRLKKEGNDAVYKFYEPEVTASLNAAYDRLIELLDLGAKVQMAKTFTKDDFIAVYRSSF